MPINKGAREEYFDIWWAPIPETPQEAFWDDDTPGATLLLSGGYGSGKTTGLVGKCLKLSNINAPRPGIFTVPDYGHFEDTILETIKSEDPYNSDNEGRPRRWFLEDHQFHYRVTRHGLHLFEWEGGGEWHVMSAKQPGSIKGPNRAWGAMDEPGIQSYEAWRNTVMRIRDPMARLRQMAAAGTPEGLNWLADTFTEEKDGYYKIFRMATSQNTELLKGQPDYLRQIAANATEQELQSYLHGHIVNLSGAMVYPTFARTHHWREDVPPAQPELPLLFTFDFNVDPMSCIVSQKRPGPYGPELQVVDALILNASWTQPVCEEIIKRYGRDVAHARFGFLGRRGWPGGAVIYGDATGGFRSTSSNKSNYDIIKENLLPQFPTFQIHTSVLQRVNPPERDRVNAVNLALRNALGHTRLWIRKTEPATLCTTLPLVRSLEKTQKAPGTDSIWKPAGETHTHPSDALGYLVAAEMPAAKPLIVSSESFSNADV